MKPIKNFGRFLVENTLFDPGTFESLLKDAISKAPEGSLYIEKQLSKGTVPHMKMIAKKLDMHVMTISAESIVDAGKSLSRFLTDEPREKTLVIFDDMERAPEKTINFIDDLTESRKILKQPISDLYYFAEVHIIDRSIRNYKNDQASVVYNNPETSTIIKPSNGLGTV